MQLVKSYSALFFFGLFTSSVHAHDFWLMPKSFVTEDTSQSLPVKFLVGHAQDAEAWTLNWDRIVAFRAYSPNGYSDQLSGIIANNGLTRGLAMVSLGDKGTHVIGFESYHSVSELEGKVFNDYAKKEGLSLVLSEREKLKQLDAPGREIYSRKAKTLVQIGDEFTQNVTKPIGHMLEIVPMVNPYKLQDGEILPVQVMFRGKPLENALIDFSSISDDSDKTQELLTDSEGKANFNLIRKGAWKLNVIWSVPILGNDRAEFETYFTSLTFGFQ